MAKTLKAPEVDPLTRALDAAEQPARDREAAERAKVAEEQAAEQRRWGVVATATLAKLRPIAVELARWRTAGPADAAQRRDQYFSRIAHEAADRVFEQHRGVEEMVDRQMAELERWRDALAGPLPPERLAAIIAGVRSHAQSGPAAAESGLTAGRELRRQACAPLAEACAGHTVHVQWFSDHPTEPAATPKEAA